MSLANLAIEARSNKVSDFKVRMNFDGDDAYPTGGTATFQALFRAAVNAANAALSDSNVRGDESLEILDIIGGDCGQYVAFYDKTNDKLKVLDGGSATRAEVTATTDLSGTKFNITVICK